MPSLLQHPQLTVSNYLDLIGNLSEAFGITQPLTPPEVPFNAPPAHVWLKVLLPGRLPEDSPLPTPVLFPLGMTARVLSARDQICFAKLFRFWQLCEKINERAWYRWVAGMEPPTAWKQLMAAVGHDEDNQRMLWETQQTYMIKFNPMCWMAYGADTSKEKWFEKYVK